MVTCMKNSDKATPIAMSLYLTSLGSNPTISIAIKPEMRITKVPNGGCPSNWHWSNFKMVVLLFILASTFLHCLSTCDTAPLELKPILIPKETGNKFTPIYLLNKLQITSTQHCRSNRSTMHNTWITMTMGYHGLEHSDITLSSVTSPFIISP